MYNKVETNLYIVIRWYNEYNPFVLFTGRRGFLHVRHEPCGCKKKNKLTCISKNEERGKITCITKLKQI